MIEKCQGHDVSIKYKGDCRNACSASKAYALSRKQKMNYIPRCKEDGTYAKIQCLDNNQCWCVNSMGKAISQTVLGRPNCSETVKENQKRSSPINNIMPKKKCTPNDRATFNTALTKIFYTEYKKSRPGADSSEHQMIEWKFKQLDTNKNNILEANEYQGLKKIARMVKTN